MVESTPPGKHRKLTKNRDVCENVREPEQGVSVQLTSCSKDTFTFCSFLVTLMVETVIKIQGMVRNTFVFRCPAPLACVNRDSPKVGA